MVVISYFVVADCVVVGYFSLKDEKTEIMERLFTI